MNSTQSLVHKGELSDEMEAWYAYKEACSENKEAWSDGKDVLTAYKEALAVRNWNCSYRKEAFEIETIVQEALLMVKEFVVLTLYLLVKLLE